MKKETWKQIESLPKGYRINQKGDIKNKHNKILKNTSTNNCGYKRISIRINKKLKRFFIHRLLAITFIKNKLNKPCINHKDGNKENNKLTNLEWCTHSENSKHAIKKNLYTPNTKPMIEYNKKHGFWNQKLIN